MDMKELTTKMAQLKHDWQDYEADVKKFKKEYRDLERKLLEMMDEQGIDKFHVEGVGQVRIELKLNAKINDPDKFYMWLWNRGDAAIADIKLGPSLVNDDILNKIQKGTDDLKVIVQHKRMDSYLKSAVDVLDAATHPDGVEITPRQTTVLTLK